MNDADKAALKTHVEAALAASVKDLGTLPTPKHAPANITFHMDRVWALVTLEDTRFLLTDHAVRALGGSGFTVTVDEGGVTIAPGAAPAPAPTPAPAPPVTPSA